jgi:malate dehydrogenase (oxaloacetate-decarboxylating)(NADP+)
MHDPLWNKGTAFDYYERDRMGIRGLIPPAVKSIEQQRLRVEQQLSEIEEPEQKNMHLQSLHNRNETLYFNVLVNNIKEMAPLVCE